MLREGGGEERVMLRIMWIFQFVFFSARPQAGDQEADDTGHNKVKKRKMRKLIQAH